MWCKYLVIEVGYIKASTYYNNSEASHPKYYSPNNFLYLLVGCSYILCYLSWLVKKGEWSNYQLYFAINIAGGSDDLRFAAIWNTLMWLGTRNP